MTVLAQQIVLGLLLGGLYGLAAAGLSLVFGVLKVLNVAHGEGEVACMRLTRQSERYSILITDDDSTCREALRDTLEPQGYRTLLASCGEEAIDIVRPGANGTAAQSSTIVRSDSTGQLTVVWVDMGHTDNAAVVKTVTVPANKSK